MSTLAALAVKRREEIAARQAAAAPPGTLATGRPAAAGPSSKQLLAPARREPPRSDGPTRETSLVIMCECGHGGGAHPGRAACAFRGCPCPKFIFRPALPIDLAAASLPSAHARRAKPRRQGRGPRHSQAALL